MNPPTVPATPLLEAVGLVKHYRLPRERLLAPAPLVRAVQGVSLSLAAGRALGVVGESGSGKSTLARLAMALERPTAGTVRFEGQDLNALDAAALRRARAGFQMVFQDPFGSLNPRATVERIVAEPLRAAGGHSAAQRRDRAAEVLEAVGLRAADLAKYPHEFSGGQRQRIAIARALAPKARLIVADEPVSALDVSVQAQVLNLMQDLRERFGVGYLFISHDLAVVNLVCDEIAVMYQGRVVEQGATERLLRAPAHPYTRALLDAVPRERPRARGAPAAPPIGAGVAAVAAAPATSAPAGIGACPFAPRCVFRQDRCMREPPALRAANEHDPGHAVACHFPLSPPSNGA